MQLGMVLQNHRENLEMFAMHHQLLVANRFLVAIVHVGKKAIMEVSS